MGYFSEQDLMRGAPCLLDEIAALRGEDHPIDRSVYIVSKYQRNGLGRDVAIFASSPKEAAQWYAAAFYGERARVLPGVLNSFQVFTVNEDGTFSAVGNRIWVRTEEA